MNVTDKESLISKMRENKKAHGSFYAHFYPKYLAKGEFENIQRSFMVIRMPYTEKMYMAC